MRNQKQDHEDCKDKFPAVIGTILRAYTDIFHGGTLWATFDSCWLTADTRCRWNVNTWPCPTILEEMFHNNQFSWPFRITRAIHQLGRLSVCPWLRLGWLRTASRDCLVPGGPAGPSAGSRPGRYRCWVRRWFRNWNWNSNWKSSGPWSAKKQSSPLDVVRFFGAVFQWNAVVWRRGGDRMINTEIHKFKSATFLNSTVLCLIQQCE